MSREIRQHFHTTKKKKTDKKIKSKKKKSVKKYQQKRDKNPVKTN